MIQGCNHPRTARSALGQDTCGRTSDSLLIFFPRSRCLSSTAVVEGNFWRRWLSSLLRRAGRGVRGMVPTEREGAAHQLPVPPDGLVASPLVLGPAEGVFDVFVALLHPHAQPVQTDHLFQAGCRPRWFASKSL